MPTDQVLFGVVLPAAISGTILLVAWRPWRAGSAPLGDAGAALSIGLGYIVGHVLLMGWPGRPTEPWQWLPYIVLAAAILSTLNAFARPPAWIRRALDGLLIAIALVLLLWPTPMNASTHGQAIAWLAGLWLAVVAFWISADGLAGRLRAPMFALLMIVTATAGSVVLVCSANAKLGQLMGVLTAAIGAAMIVGWCAPRPALAGGGVRVITILFCGLFLSGYSNDGLGLPAASFLLVAAAFSFAWLGQLPPIRRLKAWQTLLIRLAAVLAPAAVGTALAWRAYSSF